MRQRFGFIAVEKGYIGFDELVEAMKVQVREELSTGKHRRIGEVLVGLGYMSASQLEDVLRIQEASSGDPDAG